MLSFVFVILCKMEILVDLPYSQIVIPLFFMSLGTTIWIKLREVLWPNIEGIKYFIEIIGCTAIVMLCVTMTGWLELRLSYLLLIFSMVLLVYLGVWFFTWIQSKHDERYMNNLRQQNSEEKKNDE